MAMKTKVKSNIGQNSFNNISQANVGKHKLQVWSAIYFNSKFSNILMIIVRALIFGGNLTDDPSTTETIYCIMLYVDWKKLE